MSDPTCAYCGANVLDGDWPDCCEPSEDDPVRRYVMALWAKDWDSREDSFYDTW